MEELFEDKEASSLVREEEELEFQDCAEAYGDSMAILRRMGSHANEVEFESQMGSNGIEFEAKNMDSLEPEQ